MVERTRELLAKGEVAAAIRGAFRAAFHDTVRAYSLTVPVACTDRRFMTELLRPDMGKLATLLPELYRWYEPVRYGRSVPGDVHAFVETLERLYAETSIGTIYRRGYQPSGPNADSPFTSWPYRSNSPGSPP